jgi:hypothetical protein
MVVYRFVRKRSTRRAIFGHSWRLSSHSHTRAIRHPALRSARMTDLSRATLLSNFRDQNSRRLFGCKQICSRDDDAKNIRPQKRQFSRTETQSLVYQTRAHCAANR